MKIEEFMKEVVRQINEACSEQNCSYPDVVEFCIQVNSRGEVCEPGEFCASTVRVEM